MLNLILLSAERPLLSTSWPFLDMVSILYIHIFLLPFISNSCCIFFLRLSAWYHLSGWISGLWSFQKCWLRVTCRQMSAVLQLVAILFVMLGLMCWIQLMVHTHICRRSFRMVMRLICWRTRDSMSKLSRCRCRALRLSFEKRVDPALDYVSHFLCFKYRMSSVALKGSDVLGPVLVTSSCDLSTNFL